MVQERQQHQAASRFSEERGECGERFHVNGKSTIFLACHNPNLAPCRDSAMASSEYHALGCLPQPAGRGSSYLDKIIAQVCTNCMLMNIFTLVCTIGSLDGIVCTSGTVSAHWLKNISGVHNTCSHCALCALCALCAHCAHHVHTETTRCSAPLLRNKAES